MRFLEVLMISLNSEFPREARVEVSLLLVIRARSSYTEVIITFRNGPNYSKVFLDVRMNSDVLNIEFRNDEKQDDEFKTEIVGDNANTENNTENEKIIHFLLLKLAEEHVLYRANRLFKNKEDNPKKYETQDISIEHSFNLTIRDKVLEAFENIFFRCE